MSFIDLKNYIKKAKYKSFYDNSKNIIIEIGSRNIWTSKKGEISVYMGLKQKDFEINDDSPLKTLTNKELEDCILKIKEYISPRRLIILTH